MKKATALIVTMAMAFSLSACGGDNGNSTGQQSPNIDVTEQVQETTAEKELTLAQEYTVEDYLKFELVKVHTTKTVEASMSGGLYYENTQENDTYVDVVLDITNIGSEAIGSDKIMVATAVNSSGTEYPCYLYAVETNNNTYVSQYETVAPLSKVRFHCGISVPESETSLTIKLDINEEVYSCNYTVGDTVADTTPLSVGQSIEVADYATMQFQGVEYTADLLPSNASGFYTHYQVDNADNIYLVAKFDVTNYQGTGKQCDTFVSVKATFNEQYTYTGFVVVEDEDGTGFSSYEDIAPLSTRRICVLVEVPKVVMEYSAELVVTFNGQEYTYTQNV